MLFSEKERMYAEQPDCKVARMSLTEIGQR